MPKTTEAILATRSAKCEIINLEGELVGVLPLDHLQFAIVDANVHPHLSRWAWTINRSGYVLRRDSRTKRDVFLHREVNCTPDDLFTDHINGDRLDNRKANLRTVTTKQNARGFQSPRKAYAPRGVTYNPKTGKYRAQIGRNGKSIYGGEFATIGEAALVAASLMNANDETLDRASAAAEAEPRPEIDLS